MACICGHAPKGERPRERGARKLENDEICRRLHLTRITAPQVLDGPINALAFEAYAEKFLAPTLAPGDILVMDNPSSPNVRKCENSAKGRAPA